MDHNNFGSSFNNQRKNNDQHNQNPNNNNFQQHHQHFSNMQQYSNQQFNPNMQSNSLNMDMNNMMSIHGSGININSMINGGMDINEMLNNMNNQGGMDINSMLNNMNNPNSSGVNSCTYSVKTFSSTSTSTSGGKGAGQYTTQSFSSNVKYDGSGDPHKETFQNKAAGMYDANGNKIEESQSAYQNSTTGMYKACHQRKLGDQGIQLTKEKNFLTGDENQENIYKGLDESRILLFIYKCR